MEAPVARLVRTEHAPPELPAFVDFGAQNASASIGRLETNTVVLNDKRISKVHARLSLRTCKQKGVDNGEILKRVFIKDSSSFGTFINGQALVKEQWVMLQQGDIIGLRKPHGCQSLGEYRAEYQAEPGAAPVAKQFAPPEQAASPSGQVPAAVMSTAPGGAAPENLRLAATPAAPRPAATPAPPLPSPPAAPALATPTVTLHGGAALANADGRLAPATQEPAPLSPISEVSEVSAPEEAAGSGGLVGAPPGMPPMMPMMPMQLIPGMPVGAMQGLPGNMFMGMPGMTGPTMMMMAPGVPPPPTGPRPHERSVVASPEQRPAPVVITIEEELVGKIIGRGGEVVKQLQKESGARIDISKTGTDGPIGKRTVYLSGTQACIDRAKQMIDDTLNKARELTGSSNPNACVIKVSHELVGILIGKNGETIKDLKKESGARIDISKEAGSDSQDDRLVHITGPPECIEFAKKMVEEMLSRAKEKGSDGDAVHAVEEAKPTAPTQATIQVLNELVGMLIGKGGDTINSISKDCAVRIEISKDEPLDKVDKRTVYLSGTPENIERAKQMIKDTLSRSRESRLRERSRSRSRRSRSRSRSHHGGNRKVLRVAQEYVGMLIGKGGETIKQVSRDSGARIEVSKDDRDTDRSVTLSGNPEAVEKATDMIDDIISRARDRAEKRSDRRGRSRSRGHDAPSHRDDGDRYRDGADDGALVLADRRSPIRDGVINEKIYIDEVSMPFRPSFLPEHEDGLPTDLEIFVRGLPRSCTERDLWEHLYRVGATDVKEILLLRRQKVSKGMAYVVFNRHDHALLAKVKLQGAPSTSVPCGQMAPDEAAGFLLARFSESERCINGRQCIYGTDMVGLLLGTRGKCMEQVKEASGLRKVLLTGRSMRSYGQVDEDPRLHMVVYYNEQTEADNVIKAIEVWGEQLGSIHKEIVEKAGKGMGKGRMPFPMPMDGPMMMRPPFPVDGMPPVMRPPPFLTPPLELTIEAPVFMQRRLMPAKGEKPEESTPAGPKVFEATCLRGRELRWQPWPEVSAYNEEWAVVPLRWGQRGEIFVLMRKRDTGELRVCAADVHQPAAKWPTLSSPAGCFKAARYRSFTFNDHLFVISIDRETGSLKVYHVPDPSAPWDVAFQTTLPEEASSRDDAADDSIGISRLAKLYVFYAQDKSPHVIAVEPKGDEEVKAKVLKIRDPGKPWSPSPHVPPVGPGARLTPVYAKTTLVGPKPDFEVALLSLDSDRHEMSVFHTPNVADQPWVQISRFPFAGDSRLCFAYVPGKPEPVLMAGSPTDRMLKLCHLNLVEWLGARKAGSSDTPKVPLLEEKFSRRVGSVWPDREGLDPERLVATPIDCTTDLPVSRHPWAVGAVLPNGGEGPPSEMLGPPGMPGPLGVPGPPGMPAMFERPPFDRPPFERPPFDARGLPPWGPFGERPPFDPRGMPPFCPPGFDPQRPPMPLGGPPFAPLGPAAPAARPPFEAPPGEWFGGMRPPFEAAKRATGADPANWEVGSLIEGNFRGSGQWQPARIVARHGDGTFDVEYKGDYIEWKVPAARLRPMQEASAAAPNAAPPPGGAQEEGERRHRRHRHRHHHRHAEKEGEKDGNGDGGVKKRHHRHRRHRSKDRERSKAKDRAQSDDDDEGKRRCRSRKRYRSKSKSPSKSRSRSRSKSN